MVLLTACGTGSETESVASPVSAPDSIDAVRAAAEDAARNDGVRVGVVVIDERTGATQTLDPDFPVRAGSTDKVPIAMALARTARERGQEISPENRELVRASLTASDNEATEELFEQLGDTQDEQYARLLEIYHLLGRPEVAPTGGWGETEVTARDQVEVVRALRRPPQWLDGEARRMIHEDMTVTAESRDPSQEFGLGALLDEDLPAFDDLYLKNGWLPEEDGHWSVSSVGVVTNPRCDLSVAITTFGASTAQTGQRVTSDVAREVGRRCAEASS